LGHGRIAASMKKGKQVINKVVKFIIQQCHQQGQEQDYPAPLLVYLNPCFAAKTSQVAGCTWTVTLAKPAAIGIQSC